MIAINKHKGANSFLSHFANVVVVILLKKPTYLKSPIALNKKSVGIP